MAHRLNLGQCKLLFVIGIRNGCSMCISRCPSYGPRISVSERAGVQDVQEKRNGDQLDAFNESCKLEKDTLSENIVKELDEKGVVILKIPTGKLAMVS
ncbi:hypothetical protein CPJCM30710_10300 [Clostridium polyendosporum]|uniref:Uncharacterized protein n=1 Tax=Clostridium polyendosporum TaxID=69208 RepID=A0A919VDT1_9CLOT|nr:hypothetical protein CPJCM30710_10300 [Clostridium polyendosporum]